MSLPEPQVFSDLSITSLEDLRLAAFNRAANLRKDAVRTLELCIEQWALASLAAWMIENRKDLHIREKQGMSIVDGVLPKPEKKG